MIQQVGSDSGVGNRHRCPRCFRDRLDSPECSRFGGASPRAWARPLRRHKLGASTAFPPPRPLGGGGGATPNGAARRVAAASFAAARCPSRQWMAGRQRIPDTCPGGPGHRPQSKRRRLGTTAIESFTMRCGMERKECHADHMQKKRVAQICDPKLRSLEHMPAPIRPQSMTRTRACARERTITHTSANGASAQLGRI